MNLSVYNEYALIFRPSFNNPPTNTVKRVNDFVSKLPAISNNYEPVYNAVNSVGNSPTYGVNFAACSSFADVHRNAQTLDKGKEENVYLTHLVNQMTNNHGSPMNTQRTNVPIWCIDCKDNIVVLGCVDGCLEFWECSSGVLQVYLKRP